ncbi:MAG: DUF1972 domain-containing protein [Saprospiraceae bacterium]
MGSKKKIKLGILGCRGIPNHYGGYEQFAQYLSKGLVARGCEVWVYNSSLHPYKEDEWEGVKLIHCYDPEDKFGAFGQFVYDFHCLRDARKRPFDVLLQLGYTSSAIWHRLWPKNMLQVMHMDGLEWKRSKYSPLVQRFLYKMEAWAAQKADALVADSEVIQTYLKDHYQQDAAFIPYGAHLGISPNVQDLAPWGLVAKQYFLAIARFVPENNLEPIIQGYLASQHPFPLVLVGELRHRYGQYLQKRYASSRVVFIGSIYDQAMLDSLRFHAGLYFHGHSVGGTNPSLLEAMACQVPICAHDNPFNRAVLGTEALYFEGDKAISAHLSNWEQIAFPFQWIVANAEKIQHKYHWEKILDAYEGLFGRMLKDRWGVA